MGHGPITTPLTCMDSVNTWNSGLPRISCTKLNLLSKMKPSLAKKSDFSIPHKPIPLGKELIHAFTTPIKVLTTHLRVCSYLAASKLHDIHEHESDSRGKLFVVGEVFHTRKVLVHPTLVKTYLHSIYNSSHQYKIRVFNSGHTVTSTRLGCFNSGHTVTSTRLGCFNSGPI